MEGRCPICGAPMTGNSCEYCDYKKESPKPKPKPKKVQSTQQQSYQAQPQDVTVNVNITQQKFKSPKDWLVTLLLAIFLGGAGIHKFYEGKIFMGILYFFTVGLFGLGWIIDIIKILLGKEKDSNGLPITNG